MKALFRTVACAICLLLVNSAYATMLHVHFYTPYPNPFDPGAESFTIEATFDVRTDRMHTIQLDPACTGICDEVWFSPDARFTSDALEPFTMVKTLFWDSASGIGIGSPAYFEYGALWTIGTHYDILEPGSSRLHSVLTVSAVPEPAAYLLLLAGGAVVAVAHRRTRAPGRQQRA